MVAAEVAVAMAEVAREAATEAEEMEAVMAAGEVAEREVEAREASGKCTQSPRSG